MLLSLTQDGSPFRGKTLFVKSLTLTMVVSDSVLSYTNALCISIALIAVLTQHSARSSQESQLKSGRFGALRLDLALDLERLSVP